MKNILQDWRFIAGAVVVVALAAFGVVVIDGRNVEEEKANEGERVRVRRLKGRKAEKFARKGDVAVKEEKRVPKVPNFDLDTEDESKMSPKFRQIYEDLEVAFDEEDKAKVFALVKKLQNMDEWPDLIPTAIKLNALDALAWFGLEGISGAVGFLGDGNNEVVEAALSAFEEMLDTDEYGDKAVAEVLVKLIHVVHDTEALDNLITELDNMRNSVKARTAIAIFESGNKEAIAVLQENMESIFADNEEDYDVLTKEDVRKYMSDNPDDPDDDDFYGPNVEDGGESSDADDNAAEAEIESQTSDDDDE